MCDHDVWNIKHIWKWVMHQASFGQQKTEGISQMQHDTFILTHLAIIELNMAMQISLCSPYSSLGPVGLIPDFLQ